MSSSFGENNDDDRVDIIRGGVSDSSLPSFSGDRLSTRDLKNEERHRRHANGMVSVEDDEDSDDDDDDEDEEDDVMARVQDLSSWPSHTLMKCSNVIPAEIIGELGKYFKKRQDKLWTPANFVLHDETNDDDDDDDDDENNNNYSREERCRQFLLALHTKTLQRIASMIETTMDQCIEVFIDKFTYFTMISSKSGYGTFLRFEPGHEYGEHIECTSMEEDDTCHRLCVYACVHASKKGGEFLFRYQGAKVKLNTGDVLVFPACPLHPVQITPVVEGELILMQMHAM